MYPMYSEEGLKPLEDNTKKTVQCLKRQKLACCDPDTFLKLLDMRKTIAGQVYLSLHKFLQ